MKPSDPTSLPWSEERRARLALSHVCEPNLSTLKKIAEQGALMSLDQMRSGQFEADDAYAARGHTLDIDRFVHNLDVLGVRYLVPGDAEWPVGVDDLPGPPIGLFVRGPLSLSEATQRAIGIVGARAASSYGVQVATELAAGVVDRQATVVSGAAFGIDAAAHRGALGANGPTIAVLACGLDRPYPPAHTALIDRIGEVGAIVSEIPAGRRSVRITVPGPQPAHCHAQSRGGDRRGESAFRVAQHGQLGPQDTAPRGCGAGPRDRHDIRRVPPAHPGNGRHPGH